MVLNRGVIKLNPEGTAHFGLFLLIDEHYQRQFIYALGGKRVRIEMIYWRPTLASSTPTKSVHLQSKHFREKGSQKCY